MGIFGCHLKMSSHPPEMLVLGCGDTTQMLHPELRVWLRKQGISVEIASTVSAALLLSSQFGILIYL